MRLLIPEGSQQCWLHSALGSRRRHATHKMPALLPPPPPLSYKTRGLWGWLASPIEHPHQAHRPQPAVPSKTHQRYTSSRLTDHHHHHAETSPGPRAMPDRLLLQSTKLPGVWEQALPKPGGKEEMLFSNGKLLFSQLSIFWNLALSLKKKLLKLQGASSQAWLSLQIRGQHGH